jgi:hypothetical protein
MEVMEYIKGTIEINDKVSNYEPSIHTPRGHKGH